MSKVNREYMRMAQWLLLSLLAYFVAYQLATIAPEVPGGLFPRAQTVLWKVGHLNLAAYIGYWIDRNAFRDRVEVFYARDYMQHLRRALIIAASIIGFALAL